MPGNSVAQTHSPKFLEVLFSEVAVAISAPRLQMSRQFDDLSLSIGRISAVTYARTWLVEYVWTGLVDALEARVEVLRTELEDSVGEGKSRRRYDLGAQGLADI